MKTPMTKHRAAMIIGLVIFWLVYAYIWAIWGWNDSTLFSRWWYFDTLGHAIFGVGATITLLFLFRNSVHAWFFFGGNIMLTVATVSTVAFAGVFWEFIEAAWDVYHHGVPDHIRAQNSALDTSLDILSSTLTSFITVLIYILYSKWYWRRNPNEQVEELGSRIELLSQHMKKEIREQRLDIRKALRRRLKKKLLKIFRK